MIINRVCRECHRAIEINVDLDEFMLYEHHGVPIQDAMPHNSEGERELLTTGICGDCWDRMFGHLFTGENHES